MEQITHLFDGFPLVSKKDWLAKIEQDLKGKPLADLQWKLGQLTLDPFAHPDDLEDLPQPLPGSGNDWEIGEDIEAHDILHANRQALYALENGVQALRFLLDENLGDHRMDSLLESIDLSVVSLHFFEKNKNANPIHLLHHFYHTAKAEGKDTSRLAGSVNWAHRESVVLPDALELLEFASEKLPAFKVLTVSAGDSFENGIVRELAALVRKGEEWIAVLSRKGFSPAVVNGFLQFSIPVGTNYFVEIAKPRALKLLWANALKAWEVENAAMPPIEAHIALSEETEGTYNSLIQATTQAMSAVLGGVSRLTVSNGQASNLQPPTSSLSTRIVRNVQHILKMESHFGRVADPVAGSYFLENLTEKLAGAAWKEFQTLQDGGYRF